MTVENSVDKEASSGNNPIAEWWELNHRGKVPDYKTWLTGSAGPEVWRYLGILNRIQPGKRVLNIGVGLGHCTRELVRRGCLVDVLDISPAALQKVENLVNRAWLPKMLHDMPAASYDLAISNLVTQHMCDDDLELQIGGVLRALKQDGVFAMQFAGSVDMARNDVLATMAAMKNGEVLRSLTALSAMVDRNAGQILWASRIARFPQYRSTWYGVHIVRQDYPEACTINRESDFLTGLLRFLKIVR
jgi:SAM-dependent methyltransferase